MNQSSTFQMVRQRFRKWLDSDQPQQPPGGDGGGGDTVGDSWPPRHPMSVNSSGNLLKEFFPPLLVSGLGMMLAGFVLDQIQPSTVFSDVPELIVLIPALLGLKGNLEMTMTSRLSSMANCGQLSGTNRRRIYQANLALGQCQSIVVGFAAATLVTLINFRHFDDGESPLVKRFLLLAATSITSASLTSLLLAVIMIQIIELSLKFRINPDNVATPIAAALGDLITLLIFYAVATGFHSVASHFRHLPPAMIIASLATIPWLTGTAKRGHPSTAAALGWQCWTPILMAMLISSISGQLFRWSARRFRGMAIYQPLINGFGGNMAAIQASRLSTHLHWLAKHQRNDNDKLKRFLHRYRLQNSFSFLHLNDAHSRSARNLIVLVVPLQIIFNLVIWSWFTTETSTTPWLFLVCYCTAALVQVYVLLYLTGVVVITVCRFGIDPDNSAIPYLTAIGDLLGTALLTAAFAVFHSFSDQK